MRKITLAVSLLISPTLYAHGLYVGAGGGLNSVGENYTSTFFTTTASATDKYSASANSLVPFLQIGYSKPFQEKWYWGLVAQWMYLGYQTPNVESSQGQHIQNASFSSINFFGANVVRDFNSLTTIKNQFVFLVQIGMQLKDSSIYFGVGPALYNASNTIYVSAIHTPSSTGNNLVTTSVNRNQLVWGGAVQLGYNYNLGADWFINANYTYLQSATANFNNAANTNYLNGSGAPSATTLHLNRAVNWSSQNLMLSLNKSL